MGFQPIELQTMLSQLDKVGHEQVLQTQAARAQQEIQRDVAVQKRLEKDKSVEAAQKKPESISVNKDGRSSGGGIGGGRRREESGDSAKKAAPKNPKLGNFLDIFG